MGERSRSFQRHSSREEENLPKFRLEYGSSSQNWDTSPVENQKTGSGVRFFFDRYALPYLPFDPKAELQELVRKTRNSPEKRLQEIQLFKKRIVEQQRGLKELIETLTTTASATEGDVLDRKKARALIADAATRYQFSHDQLNAFEKIYVEFFRRVEAVNQALKDRPRGEDIFSQCFGQKPKGKIELRRKLSCAILVIHDAEDYRIAYGQKADTPHLLADGAAGNFWPNVPFKPELNGALITVRAETPKIQQDHRTVHNEYYSFTLTPDTEFKITNPSIGSWLMQGTFHRRELKEVRFIRESVTALDLPHLSFEQGECYVDGQPSGDDSYETEWSDLVWNNQLSMRRFGLKVDCYGYAYIDDQTALGTEVETRPTGTAHKQSTLGEEEATIIHELRHHFNDLFMPIDERAPANDVVAFAFKNFGKEFRGDTLEEALKPLLFRLAREQRRETIDANLQDELLAFYEEDTSLELIEITLLEGSYYLPSYLKQWRDYIIRNIKLDLQDRPIRIVHKTRKDRTYRDPLPSAQDGLLQEVVRESFQDAKKDLRDWLNAIRLLETKGGLSRKEVLGLISQAPAWQWQAIAARHIQQSRLNTRPPAPKFT